MLVWNYLDFRWDEKFCLCGWFEVLNKWKVYRKVCVIIPEPERKGNIYLDKAALPTAVHDCLLIFSD